MPASPHLGDDLPIGQRHPWWEDMVEELLRCEGMLTYT